MSTVYVLIKLRLIEVLTPLSVTVHDDSHLHRSHQSHFRVRVVAQAFEGKTSVQRHRMIHAALEKLAFHALSIRALTPQQADHTSGQSGDDFPATPCSRSK